MARRVYAFLEDVMAGHGDFMIANGTRLALKDVSGSDQVVLFVSGHEASLFSVPVPVRSEAEARRAAPFAIEDDIAEAVEDVHVALGSAPDDLQTPRQVCIVSGNRMTAWTEWLASQPKLASAQLVAEHSLLVPGEVLTGKTRYLANLDGRMICVDRTLPADLLNALFEGHAVDVPPEGDLLLELTGAAERAGEMVDLRQGEFRYRKRADLTGLRQWRLAGGLAAALALVWCASSFLEIRSLQTEREAVEAQTRAIYLSVFPEAPRNGNYLRAAADAAREAGGSSAIGFQEASAALYTALDSVPAAELRSLRYDQNQDGLVARIAYGAYGDDADLKSALIDAGVNAELGDARLESGFVVGDVAIEGVAP